MLRRVVFRSGTSTVLSDDIFGYDGASDSPAYTRPYAGGTLTTYLAAGAVSAIDVAGVVTYQHANAHGDIVGTTDTAGTWTPVVLADEYGVTTAAPSSRLGWLGQQQRFTVGGALGLTRMGVRLYDPRLGRFLQTDPIQGGSANDYDYVAGDPVNDFDLAGTFSFKKFGRRLGRIARWAAPIVGTVAFAVCVAGTGGLCGGLGLAAAALSASGRLAGCIDRCSGGLLKAGALSAGDFALNWAGGGAIRGAVKGQ